MIQALKKSNVAKDNTKESKSILEKNATDIIVKRIEPVVEYKDGKRIEYKKETLINVTKKVNATAELVKTNQIEKKLEEIKQIAESV